MRSPAEIFSRLASAIVLVTSLGAHATRCAAQGKEPPGETVVLRHAVLLDGVDTNPKRDVAIVIRNGRIVSILRDGAGARFPDPTLDLHGAWVVPGLIDAHAHVGLDTSSRADAVMDAARRAIEGGATTLRSAGASAYADVAVRQRFNSGDITLPRMLPAGFPLTPIVSEDWLRQFPMVQSRLVAATAADTVIQLSPGPGWRLTGNAWAIDTVIGVLKARGAQWVKVFATGRAGLGTSSPLTNLLTETDMRGSVASARKRGMLVEAHAHGDAGVRAATRAGVRTIEHGTYASEASLKLMRERGTCLVPTLSFWDELETSSNPVLVQRAEAMRTAAIDAVQRARKLGVAVIAGTDSPYRMPGSRGIAGEVAAMVKAGFTPGEAIVAATSTAARCLAMSDRIGALVPGRSADLLVLADDPRENVQRLGEPSIVLVGGRAALNLGDLPVPKPGVDLDGTWATGSGAEPAAKRLELRLQCNYTPPLWAIEQSGDSVRALTIPASRASGVASPPPPPRIYSVGRLDGVRVEMKGPGTHYILRYDSTTDHLRGTLNGAPFWAIRQNIIHPKGCIPPP